MVLLWTELRKLEKNYACIKKKSMIYCISCLLEKMDFNQIKQQIVCCDVLSLQNSGCRLK